MKIILASPHARHDSMLDRLRAQLPEVEVARIRRRKELDEATLNGVTYVFFIHWSWMIPRCIHERVECVVFHMTDVPFGRGGSPLQNLVVRGFTATKLSALRCTEEVDAGPVYLKRDLSLEGTAEEILERASKVAESMIVSIVRERIQPVPQEGPVTQFVRRTPMQSNIKDAHSLESLYDFIRMLDADGYPHAFANAGPFRIELAGARLMSGRIECRAVIRIVDEG